MKLNFRHFIASFTLTCGLLGLTHQLPFFWDTVQLASKHGQFFFEHGLQWQLLPTEIDSGHPPALGYYLAIIWTIFGKSLLAGHFAMAPFIFLNLLLLFRMGSRLGRGAWAFIFPAWVVADPVFLTQHALVGPDLIITSGLLLFLEGYFSKRNLLKALGVILLCLFSMRGMMVVAGLATWELLFQVGGTFIQRLKTMIPVYFPGGSVALIFLVWHDEAAGWIGYHAGSPWATAFQHVEWPGMIRNLAVLAWRWIDFGRVVEWFVIIYIGWLNRNRLYELLQTQRQWFSLLLCLAVFLLPSTVLLHNLSAHRYLLPLFMVFHLLTFQLLADADVTQKFKNAMAVIVFSVLASGHFWVYPQGVSNDWDCTLAHLPYHRLRAEAIGELERQKVDFQSVGTVFPSLNTGKHLMLNADTRQLAPKDFNENQWMLVSNVMNDFSKEEVHYLNQNWELNWGKQVGLVWMRLYKKK
ncbi:MAG: hypothetical protein JNJ57_01180 [Saprospiraceae bacterium]|nr:hypothetical protein [Saprospiraceae bacterium]